MSVSIYLLNKLSVKVNCKHARQSQIRFCNANAVGSFILVCFSFSLFTIIHFLCSCPEGITGEKCELTCADHQCDNNGTCLVHDGKLQCRFVATDLLFLSEVT